MKFFKTFTSQLLHFRKYRKQHGYTSLVNFTSPARYNYPTKHHTTLSLPNFIFHHWLSSYHISATHNCSNWKFMVTYYVIKLEPYFSTVLASSVLYIHCRPTLIVKMKNAISIKPPITYLVNHESRQNLSRCLFSSQPHTLSFSLLTS